MRQVGETVEAAGYTGAQFRTAEGASVARWSRAQGASLVERVRLKS